MNVTVRELVGFDLNQDFLDALASLTEVGLTPQDALPIFRERIKAGIRTYVAIYQDRIVGTASLFVERKFIHRGGKVGHIEDVAVHKDCQRRGIGTALVAFATAEARKLGCYKCILNCYEHLVPFYSRIGYRKHDAGLRIDL
jgi:glucosamine-phosphate N-acetyltransferase